MNSYDNTATRTSVPAQAAPYQPSGVAGRLSRVLFAPPPRWGWAAAPPPTDPPDPQDRPEPPEPWVEPPMPEDPGLRSRHAKAKARAVRRTVVAVAMVVAWTLYHDEIARTAKNTVLNFLRSIRLPEAIGDPLSDALWAARGSLPFLPVVCAMILTIGVVRGIANARRSALAMAAFEKPHRLAREDARRRHDKAMAQWHAAQERFDAADAARRAADRARSLADWYPVAPSAAPGRLDVIGGDHARHGWSSLLATMGSAELAAGSRITLLDFTGDQVGRALAEHAEAVGLPTRVALLGEGGADLDLLNSVHPDRLPACIANAVAARTDKADLLQERAFMRQVVSLVLGRLDGPVTLGRLAAGVQVLRQGTALDPLTPSEITRIADHVGDIDANEWTARQLRYLAGQLSSLAAITPATPRTYPLWAAEALSIISAVGPRDDTVDLLHRLVLQLAQQAVTDGPGAGHILAIAGADRFEVEVLQMFAEHVHRAGVRLVLLIDQTPGSLERFIGTGGAVCILRQYNHKDATMAAEFIGRDHRFVLNQTTRQSGSTWGESGGDSFGTGTNEGRSQRAKLNQTPGRVTGTSWGSGSNWGTNRGWSLSDNTSASESRSRVYEFLVEPNALMDMPDTAFLLVDSTGSRRRVHLADADPTIAVRARVSPVALEVQA